MAYSGYVLCKNSFFLNFSCLWLIMFPSLESWALLSCLVLWPLVVQRLSKIKLEWKQIIDFFEIIIIQHITNSDKYARCSLKYEYQCIILQLIIKCLYIIIMFDSVLIKYYTTVLNSESSMECVCNAIGHTYQIFSQCCL